MVYDCTITEYIQQRRMSQAEYLLTKTDLSIGQIAQTGTAETDEMGGAEIRGEGRSIE